MDSSNLIYFALNEAQSTQLMTTLLLEWGISQPKRLSSLGCAQYEGRVEKKIAFESEALHLRGHLGVKLQEQQRHGINFVEYVWSFTSDDTAFPDPGAVALLAVWPFARGIKLDPGFVIRGKARYARVRATSTNPKLLLEDLAGAPYTVDRVECGNDLWDYQLNWEMDGCALQVDVPFAQLFLAEGIERIDVVSERVYIPLEGPSDRARRGEISYVIRPPWNRRAAIRHDLITLDACIYVEHQYRWVYRPAEIRDPARVIPDGWYQRLVQMIRPRLRTVLQLRAEYIRAHLNQLNQRPSFFRATRSGTYESVVVEGVRQYREYLDALADVSIKRLRSHLDALRNGRELWRERRELLARMLESHIEGLEVRRERAVYGSFDPTRETDETRAEFEAAKQELLQVSADITEILSMINALFQRFINHRVFVCQLLIERHDREELRRQFKSHRA